MSEDNAKNYARVKRWREKHRGLVNLRQREYRKGKKLGLSEKEAAVESNMSRTEMARSEIMGADTGLTESRPVQSEQENTGNGEVELSRPPPPFETKKVGEFRMVVLPEEKPPAGVPETTDTRSRSDIAMGIWRNDQGGVISKFAYDKLQRLKEHAKENNFEMDEYSQ